MKVEELKARIDVGKTILNHLILAVMGVGAGSFSMVRNEQFTMLSAVGLLITFLGMFLYFQISQKISKYLDEFKNLEVK